MPAIDHLSWLRDELALLDAALSDADARGGSAWASPVGACPGWDLSRLVGHLGGVQRMVVQAVQERGPSVSSRHRPPTGTDLRAWLRGGGARLLEVLAADPSTPAWSFDPHGGSVGWWRRRQVHEHLIHRVDVEDALDRRSAVAPDLAADGVAEVVDVMVPLQRGWVGLDVPCAVTLRAQDTGDTWLLGSGPPVGEASGAAQDLLLALWKRSDPGALTIGGDRCAVATVLALPLTP